MAWRLRAQGGSAAAAAYLDTLQALRDDLRGRRYKAAARAAASAQARLQDAELRELPEIVGHLQLRELPGAVAALSTHDGSREHRAEALRSALAPALAHPLTAPEGHNAMAVLHALLGETAEAEAELQRTLALDPEHYRALTNLGNLRLEGGDPAGAEALYRRALKVHDYGGAHHNLSVALRRQNKRYDSVRSLKRGQKLTLREAQERDRGEPLPKTPAWVWWLLAAVAVLLLLWLL